MSSKFFIVNLSLSLSLISWVDPPVYSLPLLPPPPSPLCSEVAVAMSDVQEEEEKWSWKKISSIASTRKTIQ